MKEIPFKRIDPEIVIKNIEDCLRKDRALQYNDNYFRKQVELLLKLIRQ